VHTRLRVSYFVFGTIPPSKFENFDTSLYTREARVGALLHKLVGAHCVRPRSWESNFTYEKSQRLLRRSLRAKALGSVRSAMMHFQNFTAIIKA